MMNKKDELIDLLRDRLGDLEAPVDPALWQGIQGRMVEAAVASGTDPVTELFRNGLQGAEAPVDPGVWTSICSQLGHGAAAAGGSLTAWIGGGLAAAVVAGGLWLGLSGSDEVPKQVAEVRQELVVPQTLSPVVGEPESTNIEVAQPQTPMVQARTTGTEQAPSQEASTPSRLQEQEIQEGSVHAPVVNPVLGSTIPETEVPGPYLDKVNAIIEKAEEKVDADPRPAEKGDDQIPVPQSTATEVESSEGDESPANTAIEAMQLFIPNVFSPNSDGVNDALEVSGRGLTNIFVSIYSASNDKLVFRASDLTPWDGRDASGVLCAEGYYFYAIEALGPDGKPVSKGQVVRLFTR